VAVNVDTTAKRKSGGSTVIGGFAATPALQCCAVHGVERKRAADFPVLLFLYSIIPKTTGIKWSL
jgi:hypothetical protein